MWNTTPVPVNASVMNLTNPSTYQNSEAATSVQIQNYSQYTMANTLTSDLIPPNTALTIQIPLGWTPFELLVQGFQYTQGTVGAQWLAQGETPTQADGPLTSAPTIPVNLKFLASNTSAINVIQVAPSIAAMGLVVCIPNGETITEVVQYATNPSVGYVGLPFFLLTPVGDVASQMYFIPIIGPPDPEAFYDVYTGQNSWVAIVLSSSTFYDVWEVDEMTPYLEAAMAQNGTTDVVITGQPIAVATAQVPGSNLAAFSTGVSAIAAGGSITVNGDMQDLYSIRVSCTAVTTAGLVTLTYAGGIIDHFWMGAVGNYFLWTPAQNNSLPFRSGTGVSLKLVSGMSGTDEFVGSLAYSAELA